MTARAPQVATQAVREATRTTTAAAGTGGQRHPTRTRQRHRRRTTADEGNAIAPSGTTSSRARQAARELRSGLPTWKQRDAKDDEDDKQRNLALAKALGLPDRRDPPDPAQLAEGSRRTRKPGQQLSTRAQARERELNVELQLLRQAAKHGANPELLADSRSFMSAIAKLDPTSDDFASELGEAIKNAVDKNPAFKLAGQAPAAATRAVFGHFQRSRHRQRRRRHWRWPGHVEDEAAEAGHDRSACAVWQ